MLPESMDSNPKLEIMELVPTTVEPLLKDSPNKGHHRSHLPTKDAL